MEATTTNAAVIDRIRENLRRVIIGNDGVLDLLLVALLCRGHLLIEAVPGLGKTTLAKTLAKSVGLTFKRIQATPDLLPSDVTGVSIYRQADGRFEFIPGPVFTDILLVDEINRATPRTQSALLECMEEAQVTVEGMPRPLSDNFLVIATQNPIETEGTYPLPEAELDRFFMKLSMQYLQPVEEVRVMTMQIEHHPLIDIAPVCTGAELLRLRAAVRGVRLDNSIANYIARIVDATRHREDVFLGASPRGSLGLMRAAQAFALLRGSDFVDPEYVKILTPHLLRHRVIIHPRAKMAGASEDAIVTAILADVDVPIR